MLNVTIARRWLVVAGGMAIILGGCHSGPAASKEKRIDLWNGKDLAGWKPVVGDAAADVSQVWRVRDGVLYCSGKPNGYLRTENTYQNYYLHVEWRWPEKPANSGVFIFVGDADRVWPTCIECQLQATNAGQLILMNGATLTVDGTVRQNPSRSLAINKKAPSSEKPAGEWNTYDIYCRNNSVRVLVNGVLQNEGTSPTPSSGHIALQSEGGPIEFRNVYVLLAPDR
jgi:hypothetical protein